MRTFPINNSRFPADLWKPDILVLWLLRSSKTAAGWMERHPYLLQLVPDPTFPQRALFTASSTWVWFVRWSWASSRFKGPTAVLVSRAHQASFLAVPQSRHPVSTFLPWHIPFFWLKHTQEAIPSPEDLCNQVRCVSSILNHLGQEPTNP